jgi:BASS family bile acid:Na+ symporter
MFGKILKRILKFLKDWSMPVAMITGALFHDFFDKLAVTTPYLIFFMLLLTFSKLSPRKIKPHPLHIWLVLIQLAGSITAYLLLLNYDETVAQSALICILAPTATSAAVVTGMLGGSVASLTTYTLISSLMVAIAGPIIFSIIGTGADIVFIDSFLKIGIKVAPLLILPLVIAWFMRFFTPGLQKKILTFHGLTFYIWVFALAIVTGKTVSYLLNQENPDVGKEVLIGGLSLVLCILQFMAGKWIGRKYKKTIAGGQSLGQKNTILAIWMAQSFLNPVSSLGPAAYVLWQNSFNSWQLQRRRKKLETGKNLNK